MTALKKTLVPPVGGGLRLARLAILVLPSPALAAFPPAHAIPALDLIWAPLSLTWSRERYKTISSNTTASHC